MFLGRFESQMSRLMNEFNSLKNNILNNGIGNKSNKKLINKQSSSKSPLRIKQFWMRKDRAKCQVVFTELKAKFSGEWYFDSSYSRHR